MEFACRRGNSPRSLPAAAGTPHFPRSPSIGRSSAPKSPDFRALLGQDQPDNEWTISQTKCRFSRHLFFSIVTSKSPRGTLPSAQKSLAIIHRAREFLAALGELSERDEQYLAIDFLRCVAQCDEQKVVDDPADRDVFQ